MRANVINVIALMVAAPLLGYSIAHSGPVVVAERAQMMLANASVGMSVGVSSNPYNTLAKQLNEKAASLEEREAALSSAARQSDPYGFYAFIMSTGLLFLVALNFYMDSRRRSMQPSSEYSLDLRSSV
jgi:hypothetical protein